MKTLKNFRLILILILMTDSFVFGQLNNVITGYVGNTFPDDRWVQNYAEELDVSSDGTMVTASTWDESGRCIAVWKDGNPATLLQQPDPNDGCWGWGTAGSAAAIDDNYVYAVNCRNNLNRWNRLSNYSFVDKTSMGDETDLVVGMTSSGGDIYLIKKSGIVQKRSISNLDSVLLTLTVPGGYEVAVDGDNNIWVLTTDKEVLKYNSSGLNTGIKIAAQTGWQPSGVNYDAYNGLLLVPDNGPRRQVIKFNTSGVQVGTFGDLGGISGGTPGIPGDLRFWNISGCDTDADGNIYVALNENAVSLRKFNSSGVKQWEVNGMFFTDVCSIDPASDGNAIYSVNEHFTYDYTYQQWSLVATTCDRINHPTDPRVPGYDESSALMRRVDGNLLMFTTNMYAGHLQVYRFDGEIAIHCQTFSELGWSCLPDKNGNIWYALGSIIRKIPLIGFNNGVPVFGPVEIVSQSLPEPINSVERLEYDADEDVMYIGGWTPANPSNNWGIIGSTLARYPNWSTGNRIASDTAIMPLCFNGYYPKAMSVAGDYIFLGGVGDRGKLNVLNKSDLSSVGYIDREPSFGITGWLDIPHAVQAFKKSNGQYLILVEDNLRAKNIFYQWCPTGDCPGVVIPVKGVTVSPAITSITTGFVHQFTATVSPVNATNQAVSWSSSNPAVATVSSDGLVTGISEGYVTITVTTQDGNKTSSSTVTVNVAGASAHLTGTVGHNIAPYCCGNGGTNAFDGNTATYVDASAATGGYVQLDFGGIKNITAIKYFPRAGWASRMTNGVFQGSNDGTNYTDVYTVPSPPAYNWTNIPVDVNYQYMRYLSPANSYCNIAEIEFWGTDAIVPVTGVTVSPALDTMMIGDTTQLIATITPVDATNRTVNWSSSDTTIVMVSSTGLVTAVSPGTANITVTTQDGNKTAMSAITVSGPIRNPYGGIVRTLPGTIQSEDYDLDGEGIAYSDNDTTNQGNQYRTLEGVDIEVCQEGGYNVGWTNAGEWLEYTVNVTAGTYDISLRVASIYSNKQAKVYLDGTLLGTFTIPNTGSWQSWRNVTINNVTVSGGNYKILRIECVTDGFNVNWIAVAPVTILTGTQFDNINPYCCGNDGANAFDGNTGTYTDSEAATGGYTGIDFGSEQTLCAIKYYLREGYELRMVGGKFQGSNDNVNYTDVYTISSTPSSYDWTSVEVNVSYRYMRYLSPANGYSNVAEIEFWGGCSTPNYSQINSAATYVNPDYLPNTINVFPNPVKVGGVLHINGNEKAIVNIYSIEGRLVYTGRLINNSMKLPASIKKGLYVAYIIDGQQVDQGKFAVE